MNYTTFFIYFCYSVCFVLYFIVVPCKLRGALGGRGGTRVGIVNFLMRDRDRGKAERMRGEQRRVLTIMT